MYPCSGPPARSLPARIRECRQAALRDNALRQANRSWLEIPCRCAVADASRGAEKLSPTIRSFSAVDHRRRRPVSTISRRLMWRVSVRSSIPTISYMPDNSARRPKPSGYDNNRELADFVRVCSVQSSTRDQSSKGTGASRGSSPPRRHGYRHTNPHSPDDAVNFGVACAIQI